MLYIEVWELSTLSITYCDKISFSEHLFWLAMCNRVDVLADFYLMQVRRKTSESNSDSHMRHSRSRAVESVDWIFLDSVLISAYRETDFSRYRSRRSADHTIARYLSCAVSYHRYVPVSDWDGQPLSLGILLGSVGRRNGSILQESSASLDVACVSVQRPVVTEAKSGSASAESSINADLSLSIASSVLL